MMNSELIPADVFQLKAIVCVRQWSQSQVFTNLEYPGLSNNVGSMTPATLVAT